jgi:hypothetical protein
MKLPNKIIKYEDSILVKLPVVLNVIQKGNKSILETYKEVKNEVNNIAEFTEVLCCLYALNKIELNNESGGLRYAEGNME